MLVKRPPKQMAVIVQNKIFRLSFINENICILDQISLKFIP